MLDFDEQLRKVGDWGAYQRLVLYSLLMPATLPVAFHAYNQLFMAATPVHWCSVPHLDALAPHLSEEARRNLSIPYNNTTMRYSSCQMYDYNYTDHLTSLGLLLPSGEVPETETSPTGGDNTTSWVSPPPTAQVVECNASWRYQLPVNATSVVADWDLVCSDQLQPTLALVLLGAAGLVGNFIFGYVQDGLGRHPSFYLYLTVMVVFGTAGSFAPSYGWWLLCRVGVGFTVPAVMSTPFVLAIELVGPEQRTFTSVMMNVAYSSGLILLAVVAYLVRDWRRLSLVTTLPFLAFFLAFSTLPESPRWLVARGRLREAQKELLRIARVNRRCVQPDFLLRAQEEATLLQKSCPEGGDQRRYGVLDLLRTPNLARKTLIITFIWFTNTSVYVGLSYYAPALGGDAYFNFLLAGLAELPTYLLLWPSLEFWGRRWTLCASMLVGGAACIATVCVQDDPTATLALYCVGKFGISSSFVVLPLLASELYPTVVRGVGLSFSAVAGMVGPVVVPLINHLGTEMLVLPLLIMGVLLLVGGVCALLLPETLHQALPNTLEEGEAFGKHLTLRDFCNCRPRPRSDSSLRHEARLDTRCDAPEGEELEIAPAANSRTPKPTPRLDSSAPKEQKLGTFEAKELEEARNLLDEVASAKMI